ncbi:hypothetical protein FS837_009947 [Tulasnella sp. UAMH 9824]|nr:hypothetical protein FS837_009947 [Tulasnella sp. UAMH 9824]
MTTRSTYWGSKSILAIAIDVGTTFSGASYTFLKAGEVPEIYDVSGFKGQENKQSNSKVPSVLFYTPSGELVACGAETKKLRSRKGIRTEWWAWPHIFCFSPVKLPPGRDVVDVFGDFLKYMYDCVQTHIVTTRVDGDEIWSSLNGTARFVLSHPNGWGSHQQGRMREAAIRGGLVPDTPQGRERIEFVTEGEASFHWCIDQALTGATLKEGTRIIVADLGGGTIDVSSFLVKTPRPLRLQEQLAPQCAVEGSIIVTDRFVKSARQKLQGTPYSHEGYIETLREDFDEDAKCLFRASEDGGDDVYTVRIGGRGDDFEDENGLCSIELGYLNVNREDIAAAFEPSLVATVNAIRKHIAGRRDTHVFLVGGFAASPWILSETKRRLKAVGITCEVKRADSNTAKAVAHGGVAFYLDRNVTERTMRHTYGVSLQPSYNPSNSEHQARTDKLRTDPISGHTYVKGGFFALVKKGEVVKVDSIYREHVESEAYRAPEVVTWTQTIERYNGTRDNVTFTDMDPFAFEEIGWFRCEIPASAMTRRTGKHGAYYAVDFDIVITLGTVEIKAHVEWEDNGKKMKTPANSMWEDYY